MSKLFSKITEEEKQGNKKGDDIIYLILFVYSSKSENEEDIRDWQFKIGRQNTYDFIRSILLNGGEGADEILNVDESIIYAENPSLPAEKNKLKLSNGISLYQFMKDSYALNKIVDEGGFDIEEYHFEDEKVDE